MKFKSKTLGYALAFGAGTLFSVPAAVAATNYIQAQRTQSTIQFSGKTISQPPALVYDGSTYVQLYAIQQALKQIGMNPGWDGSVFSIHQSDIPGMSGGSTDNATVYSDVGYSLLTLGTESIQLDTLTSNSSSTNTQKKSKIDEMLTVINDNISAIQSDAPTDPKLQSILTDYLNVLNQSKTIYSDLQQVIQTQNADLIQQALNLAGTMSTNLDNVVKEYQGYSLPTN